MPPTPTFVPVSSRTARLCIAGGLLAGTIDVVFAAAYWHQSLPIVLKSIASWVLGATAFHSGPTGAWFGAGLQAALMLSMFFAYRAICRRFPALSARSVPYGAAYGLLLYALQFGVLVPLSPAPAGVFDPLWAIACCSVYIVMVGIPAARIARMETKRSDELADDGANAHLA